MREATSCCLASCLLAAGCSLIYNGNDLHGKAANRPKWVSASYPGSNQGATGLAAGDFDGDGNLDIVQIEHADNTLLVFLGRGDGTFGTGGTHPAGCKGATAVAAGDLDNDNNADIAVVCYNDNVSPETSSAATLIASGGGDFLTAAMFDPGGMEPQSIAIADFNADGNPDLVIANQGSGGAALIRGTGQGNLATPQLISTGQNAYGVAVGDVDGDKTPDAVVTNLGGPNDQIGTFTVLIASGGSLSNKGSFPADNQPFQVAIADFDGKNGADVALTAYGPGNVDVALDSGDGVFPASNPKMNPLADGAVPTGIAAADLDRDGHIDLVVPTWPSPLSNDAPSVLVFYGVGDGTFEPPVAVPSGLGSGVVIGDFDKDGKLDFAVCNDDTPGTLQVVLSR